MRQPGLRKLRLVRHGSALLLVAGLGAVTAGLAATAAPSAKDKPAPAAKATPKGAAAGIQPEDIPSGFNFPTAQPTVDGWVAKNDTMAMRNHAWDVWGGMSAPSHAVIRLQHLPIWETWYGSEEVFVAAGAPLAAGPRTITRKFRRPHQFDHLRRAGVAVPAGADADQIVSFNKFSGASGKFLMASHPTPPGGASYLYTQQAALNTLNGSWAQTVPVENRKIVDFPREAIDTKPVMWLVKKTGLTPFPLWQGTGADATTNAKNPTPTTWLNCVLVDPKGDPKTGLRPATPAEVKQANVNAKLVCDAKRYLYAPLAMIYSFALSADEAKDFNQAQGVPGMTAEAGDYAVLAAMHVTTKEIVNWTWQTFWWSGGKNPPNDFPGGSANLNAKVQGPWRNYAMCTAYSMVVPATDPKGKPVVCFNPFLETSPGIPDGIDSNCMSCHGTARWPGNNNGGYPATYLPNGYIQFNDPTWFATQTRTDFAWAIPGDAVQ